ncbi:MATE family efflux transporter [Xanthomonas populi]|uniref:MATE family efflux transporter n=1 Tax=Xanthomonas populi TaxID=53414 RepID=A0A2S7EL66_9XANT|nr:MATE family efflux transporter [Xanthomonas populi]PPU90944.1 MATE family efflux transporter [Xanthomonas populi]
MPTSAVLTEGPIGKNLLLFALPILAGNIAQSLNGSINAIWVGRYLGEAALTAAANANSIMFFLIGSVFGIGMASTILIGQAMGARDIPQERKVMGTSASFFGALSAVIAVLGWWLAPHLLTAMGTPPASQTLAEDYLRVIFLAMPLIYVFAFLSAALRGTGDARTPFRFLLLSVVLDIVFNPLLIFGLGPFPALGIAGAAWATLLAQVVALGGLLLYLRKQRHVLWLGRGGLHLFRISPTILRALIVKGVPMGLQMVMISLAMIAMLTLVNGFGTETAAAYGAALQLWTYVQMPAMAVGAACSSMAAQNVGAGLWNRVDATARTGIAANFLMTGILIAPLILFDRWTLALFLPADSPALEIARYLNHISVWSFLLFGVSLVISGVVRATGAVIPPLLILAFALWGVRVPLANVLLPHFGADAVWLSFPISSACSMLLSLAYYRWGGWRKARMLTTPADPAELAAAAEVPGHPASPVADTAPIAELPQPRQR